jgi:hypothetical protein
MKKIITLCLTLVLGCMTSFADDIDHTFEFCDANGNTVADGTVVTANTLEGSADEGFMIQSGLFVKNTSDSPANIKATLTISQIDNGDFSLCFPGECMMYSKTGTYERGNGKDVFDPYSDGNKKYNLQAEWLPQAYGKCVIKVQLKPYNTATKTASNGPTVTIIFDYPDPSGVTNINADENATVVARYSIDGKLLSKPTKGINIVKLSNGKTIKQQFNN